MTGSSITKIAIGLAALGTLLFLWDSPFAHGRGRHHHHPDKRADRVVVDPAPGARFDPVPWRVKPTPPATSWRKDWPRDRFVDRFDATADVIAPVDWDAAQLALWGIKQSND